MPAHDVIFPPMNNRPLKVDLHVHTDDEIYDHIPYSSRELVDKMADLGFDAFAITNHDHHRISPHVMDYAKERGILIIRGMELTYRRQHIVLLNFRDCDKIKTPDDVISRKRPDNLAFAPHPYFPWAPSCGKLLDSNPEIFDAIEHSHLYNHRIDFNKKAAARAAELGLPMVGTSDAHTLAQIGYTFTLVDSEKPPEAIVAAIKGGRCRVSTRPFPLGRFLGVIATMKYESAKRWVRNTIGGRSKRNL